MGFGVGQIGQHQPVAVDDARGGRPQGASAAQFGLQRPCLLGRPGLEVRHAEAGGIGADGGERGQLSCVGGDDQLAATAVRDAAVGAIAVKEPLAGDAEPGLEAAGGVVDAGMDHLAVARAGLGADGVGTLEHDGLEPGHGEPARAGEAHHPGAHHDAVDALHARVSGRAPGRARPGSRPGSRRRPGCRPGSCRRSARPRPGAGRGRGARDRPAAGSPRSPVPAATP